MVVGKGWAPKEFSLVAVVVGETFHIILVVVMTW